LIEGKKREGKMVKPLELIFNFHVYATVIGLRWKERVRKMNKTCPVNELWTYVGDFME
jgi:hypothetical protein